MSTEGRPSTQPQEAAPGRRGLVVGAVAALVLLGVGGLLVRDVPPAGSHGCAVHADDGRPPAAVTEAAGRLREGVPADVASLEVVCRLAVEALPTGPGAPDVRDDPASWVVGVDAEAPQTQGVVAAARALLDAAPTDVPFTWDLRVRDAARSLEVLLPAGGGTGLVADAVAVRLVPGVVETWFGAESGTVTVASAGDVVPVLRATAGRDLPVTTVTTGDPWVEVRQVNPGAWPDEDAVALALDVAGWDGVWRVLLDGGEPASTTLTTAVEDDAQRAYVVSRLEALVAAPRVSFRVESPAAAIEGTVGGPAPASDVAAPDGAAADGVPADGVPACTGAELDVQVLGTDAALGSRFLFLAATHTGEQPCVVQGFPGLAFTRASGTWTPDLTQLPDRATPPVVVLAPGSSVQSEVRWGAMSTAQDPDVAVAVTVQPVPGGPTVELALPTDLDVLAGATVKVRPWDVGGELPETGS
ncbi:DUF4232 domain-containing protein [Cellulomonas xiejunii]|uniref:DUF4232 domain-containing protein n=1 Tax=Cellulomonas xiejunii TaxID=2968083 RepID=UPI001D0DCB11|nr:DUF4232 domain-containing protein [Cellulomonas xiejunii]MCC2315515.1 DUF4232 domain-containing protein [Cellulomonas xiejunii]